jgi:hypothetical protein
VLDLHSFSPLATSGAHCRFTAAPAYISHRRPISLHHRNASAFPQSQPSSRFPPLLLSAYHPLLPSSQQARSSSPFLFKVLHLCFPISSRTDFVVSEPPLLQISVQTSWPHIVLLLPIAFNPLAVSGQSVSSCFLPEHSPRSHPPQLSPTLACGLPRVTLRTPPRLISPNLRF